MWFKKFQKFNPDRNTFKFLLKCFLAGFFRDSFLLPNSNICLCCNNLIQSKRYYKE